MSTHDKILVTALLLCIIPPARYIGFGAKSYLLTEATAAFYELFARVDGPNEQQQQNPEGGTPPQDPQDQGMIDAPPENSLEAVQKQLADANKELQQYGAEKAADVMSDLTTADSSRKDFQVGAQKAGSNCSPNQTCSTARTRRSQLPTGSASKKTLDVACRTSTTHLGPGRQQQPHRCGQEGVQ